MKITIGDTSFLFTKYLVINNLGFSLLDDSIRFATTLMEEMNVWQLKQRVSMPSYNNYSLWTANIYINVVLKIVISNVSLDI